MAIESLAWQGRSKVPAQGVFTAKGAKTFLAGLPAPSLDGLYHRLPLVCTCIILVIAYKCQNKENHIRSAEPSA